jgi:predicted RND superfamily exporter protein
VVPADFRPDARDFAQVRENVVKADQIGRLVANDFSAALVSAELLERDPATGERLDYLEVADQLEQKIRERYDDDVIDIQIIGFAPMVGAIADAAGNVITFFAVSLITTAVLVWLFVRSVRLTALPIACSLIAVAWTLGLLPVLGLGLDPMSMLVPFLVFAIGVSHGVQMVNAVRTGLAAGLSSRDAAKAALCRLMVPGAAALITDLAGFLTILLIDIRIIREMALSAALGVAVVIITNLLILPLLLSFAGQMRLRTDDLDPLRWLDERLWPMLAGVTRPAAARAVLLCALALLTLGLWESRNLAIGDLQPGVPELRPDTRYNRDTRFITEHFAIGVDVLQVIVETVPNGCVEYDVMAEIDRFAWHMANVPGVQSTASLPELAKVINAGWHEGDLKWRVLPRNQSSLVQAISPIESSSGLFNVDCSVMPVLIFTADHKAKTIERIVDAVASYAKASDSERLTFRLATGNVGVMAATNEVVAQAQVPMLLYIYLVISALYIATFGSVRSALCIVLPLGLVSVLSYALMARLGIGLKTSTLPVAALGVGIGVDYGIYIFARLEAALGRGMGFDKGYREALRRSGSAVLLTGLTLACGVGTWVFSDLQFQADMGLLLAFMFLANMLAALVVLPALATFLVPARLPAERPVISARRR